MNAAKTAGTAPGCYDYLKSAPSDVVVAFTGNPNVGKSTLFNAITGLKQHTGNWAGKTVESAKGEKVIRGRKMMIADLPGCYSLYSDTAEETAAAVFIKSGKADVAVTVCDPLTLERGLMLFLQVQAVSPRAVLCINLMDEAEKRGIHIDIAGLGEALHAPVVAVSAAKKQGIDDLVGAIFSQADAPQGTAVDRDDPSMQAGELYHRYCFSDDTRYTKRDRLFDEILTGKYTAIPCMLVMLFLIFWITLKGANYPSRVLSELLFGFEDTLRCFLTYLHMPEPVIRFFSEGIYRTLCWIVAVMLPPMAIFFPLFTLAEDCGVLPRIAFNLDYPFQKCSACGKQALTMCMGFGCNAVGVTGCRIIQSPREKMIAVLTNSFVPCNGRFSLILTLIIVFISGRNGSGAGAALCLTVFVLISIAVSLLVSKILSVTILKGKPSFFALEMPPFRRPKIGETVIRSVFDRTVFVLGRAVASAIPAGACIWLGSNIAFGGQSLVSYAAAFLEPIGSIMGLDGEILLGFIFAFPANEIVLPVILMAYTGGSSLSDVPGYSELGQILVANGWTVLTAVNTILFSLMHWPCATTVKTIKKETGSNRYTVLSVVIPVICGGLACIAVNLAAKIFS